MSHIDPHPSHAEDVSADGHPQRRSPWAVIGLGLAGFFLFCLLLFGVSLMFPSPVVEKPTVELANGRVLTVEAVTVGREHGFEVPKEPQYPPWMFWKTTSKETIQRHRTEERMVVWLSARQPGDHRPDDFSWFRGADFIDASGQGLPSDDFMRFKAGRNYNSSESVGSGHFEPIESDPHRPYPDHVLITFEFPLFRKETPAMPIVIYGEDRANVGAIEIPWPEGYPESFPRWEAEPLPVEREVGPFTVRLKEVKPSWRDIYQDRGPRRSVSLEFEILEDGAVRDDWAVMFQKLRDPLGNESQPYQLQLPPSEPVWEVSGTLFRKQSAEYPEGVAVTRRVELPKADQRVGIAEHIDLDHGRLTLLSAFGPGEHVERNVIVSRHLNSSYGSSNSKGSIEVNLRSDPAELRLNIPTPFFVLREEQMPDRGLMTIRATDGMGNVIHGQDLKVGDYHVFVLDPKTDLSEVDVRIAVQEPLEFSMRVPAPEFPPPPPEEPVE